MSVVTKEREERAASPKIVPPAEPTGLPSRLDRDIVDEQSADSFPASDAPSWTVVTGIGQPCYY